jgi:two-component system, OmpR family, sensor kinase
VLQRLSLRARLLLAVVALAGVGLAVAGVATYTSLRSFMLHRVDMSLNAGHPQIEADVEHGDEGGPGGEGPRPTQGIDWYEVRTLGGSVLAQRFLVRGASSPPDVPATITLPAKSSGPDHERATYFTVPAQSGHGRYRIRASVERSDANQLLLVGASLAAVDATLHRLLLIELLVAAAVLAGIVVVGLWLVRTALRPLDAIEHTAAAIAAGDLSRRVELADRDTEVGRLGLALNAMLGQIETAFRAREASERKLRRFVADASHELRTPLAAVRAYAELFTRGAASRPADLERSMSGISRESERMSLLVEDLLLLARLDEGRPLERKPLELEKVVNDAVETARTLDPERPISVELGHAHVDGDRERLRQVMDNLLSNARSHTPAGTPVHVSVSSENGKAEIAVSDEGPGLTPEQASHVFERFYRTDASRARASGGVGLGLSIVAAVAEAHGGSASAEGSPGRGATFRVHLPLAGQ